MSNQAVPISHEQFAGAIQNLPLSSLHRTAAELRNSIAHLDYSNEQLKPFAEGTDGSKYGEPDEDCRDAICENEIVIARMLKRIGLLKAEVEARGSSWLEFQGGDESRRDITQKLVTEPTVRNSEPGVGRSTAWEDGTFTTGRIVVNETIDSTNNLMNDISLHGITAHTSGWLDGVIELPQGLKEGVEADKNDEGLHL